MMWIRENLISVPSSYFTVKRISPVKRDVVMGASQNEKNRTDPIVTSKMLLPTELETAMSPSPFRATRTDVIKSGIEVPAAKNVRPIISGGTSKLSPTDHLHMRQRERECMAEKDERELWTKDMLQVSCISCLKGEENDERDQEQKTREDDFEWTERRD